MIKDSESWLNMKDMNFIDIIANSNIVFDDWKNFQYVLNEEYKDSILKPVNNYVKHFGIMPDIKKISNNHYAILYKTSAEIFLKVNPNKTLYAVEKSWLRQFYPSINNYQIDENELVFKNIYRFYIPWFIDTDLEYDILNTRYADSVLIFETKGGFQKADKNCIIKDTGFVDFCFTRSKSHMINDGLGLIKRGTPIYEIHIYPDDYLSSLIEKEYVK